MISFFLLDLSVGDIEGHVSCLLTTKFVSLVPGEEGGVVIPSQLHIIVTLSRTKFVWTQRCIFNLKNCFPFYFVLCITCTMRP